VTSLSRGNIKMAIASVRSTKWRSLFTMLGVIIGVVSVVMVVSIGEGIKHQVGGQIAQLGKDLITVRPGKLAGQNGNNVSGVNFLDGTQSSGSLTVQDVSRTQGVKGVALAVPLGLVNGEVQTGKQSVHSVPVIATTSDLPAVLSQSPGSGGFFSADVSTQPNVAVLGSNAAESIFHQATPLGRSFQFFGQTFFVQGVFNQFDTNPLSFSTDFNDAVFIPLQTAQTLTDNNVPLYELLVKPDNPKQSGAMAAAISGSLASAYKNQQQFTVLSQDQSLSVTNHILDLLTRLIVGIAAISLLVGGIGIMDVMLVSVTERMHEIGIRKALGASNRQILEQFLVESTVLSLTGGLIGIAVSLLLIYALTLVTNLSPMVNWQIMAIATFVSLSMGILFGSVPALKAARKDPIDALRNE
jgi:putative ABC transport system permease protein